MNERLNDLKEWLEDTKHAHEEIIKEIEPLENKRQMIEDKISTLEHLIALEEKGAHPMTGRFVNKPPQEVYIKLIETDFRNRTFKEHEIRELATNEGLRTKHGNPIAGSYSRLLIANFVKNGLLEKPERGLYQAKIQKLERVRNASGQLIM